MIVNKLKNLPPHPGCYYFQDSQKNIIYVGKAKNLQKRIKSYFLKNYNTKTQKLISEIHDVFYILTNNEQEAFLLESNLIKEHTPKYNFKLIDDKTYPYLEITQEKHPRLKISRYKNIPPKKMLFGPYPHRDSLQETLLLLYKIYPLRRCHPLQKKACFYFHLGQCLGACAGKKVDYQPHIRLIQKFLKGDNKIILQQLKKAMQEASNNLCYERALELRDMIKSIQNITQKHVFKFRYFHDSDVLAVTFNEDEIALQILKIRLGKIVDTHSTVFFYVGSVEDNILTYLNFYYQKNLIPTQLIIGPELYQQKKIFAAVWKMKITSVMKGEKYQLYNLAFKNAQESLTKYNLVYRSPETLINQALSKLSFIFKKDIQQIDVFDSSQLFGKHQVAAKIVFSNLQFQKKFYRKYLLDKTVNNDLDALKEVLTRCYQKLTSKDLLPDLILVDGGIAQFNLAQTLLNKFHLNIPLGALKKDHQHQLISLITSNQMFPLKTEKILFNFLRKISYEVHRFVLTFHRQTKRKQDMKSLWKLKSLEELEKKKIFTHFSDLSAIENASYEEFKKIGISEKKFLIIKKFLQNYQK